MEHNPEQLAHDHAIFQEFHQSKAYHVWNRYLEMMGDTMTQRLQNGVGDPLDTLRYYQGVLAGLRMAQQVPENVEAWTKMSK